MAKPNIKVRLGRRMVRLRTAQQMTQAKLADRAEISREHLSELENGKKEMGVCTLEKIANAFGISLAELLNED